MTSPVDPFDVQVEDLTLRYPDTTALDRLNLTLTPGKIYGLLGRNGSGKTSLMSILAAFRQATAGTVRVAGQDPFENEQRTRSICMVRESGDIAGNESCERVLTLNRMLRPHWDQAYAERLVERFGLPLRRRPQKLSLGQRAALACIIGLASRSPLTMFDESYLGMDAPSRYAFYEELLADYAVHRRTIIVSTHLIEEFGSLFEEVVMIDRGRLLIHDETDNLRRLGAAIIGPAATVEWFVDQLTVLHRRDLGGTRSATIYGALSESQRRQAAAHGLQVEPVALQDLFVHLTTGEPAETRTGGVL